MPLSTHSAQSGSTEYPHTDWPCHLALSAAFILLACGTALSQQLPGDGAQSFPDLPHVRGTVKAIHGNDFSIQTEEGKLYTVHISDNTHIYKNRQPLPAKQIHAGDMLIAGGSLDNANLLRAIFVADIDAATVEKLRNDLGKTWIAGKVLKIEETKITIQRPDHQEQVIEADESTSFRKDGDSVTLLDVHPGDIVRGKGSIKNGVFVPTQLVVLDPNRSRPIDSSSGPGAP